ncbi:hypothetical protein BFW01_g10375 [Lasiodiplodia theobromae]|uniref:Uncharacterized protein n=1 Tax=Lasiodiplodia theobromae TaxID=45133 RepID=A0A8H7INW4_9PEZI|nr:hypothetical protein BFW01_g10375 [Lasiodiplodia theobromae]
MAPTTKQQVEHVAWVVASERNPERAAEHVFTFLEEVRKGLVTALPDQPHLIYKLFADIAQGLRPYSTLGFPTVYDAHQQTKASAEIRPSHIHQKKNQSFKTWIISYALLAMAA